MHLEESQSAPAPGLRRDIFVARQPVFDPRGDLFAYELLFRDGLAVEATENNSDTAKGAVLLAAYVDEGLERITGNHRVMVNFTERTLLAHAPTLFPKEKLIVELPDSLKPTPEVLAECKRLADAGYDIALDNFSWSENQRALLNFASIAKLDFLKSSKDVLKETSSRLRATGVRMLAEKIEDHETLEYARSLGCELFQGFFFSKPEIMQSKSLQSSKLQLMQLMAEVAGHDFDIAKIERTISSDVAISYKLLRYINSAMFRTAREISSIRHAVTMLGRTEFKKFISLLVAGEMADDKPLELTRLALVRGRFCELLAESREPGTDSSEYFLLGLLSLLDAMLDVEMSTVIDELPLQARIKEALLSMKGPCAPYLELAVACEMGDWDLIEELENSDDEPTELYWDAVEWADQMIEARSDA